MKIKKLSRRAFRRAVREGRGSVFLHLSSYGLKGGRKILVSALEENPCFCSIEGGGCGARSHDQPERVDWLLRLLDSSDMMGTCVDHIEKLLKDKRWLQSTSNSAFSQMALIAAYLFERGHARFKPHLFRLAMEPRLKKNPELIAAALSVVASFEGLDRVVKMLSESSASCWQYGAAYQAACKVLGEEQVEEFIQSRLSQGNAFALFKYEVGQAKKFRGLFGRLISYCLEGPPTSEAVLNRIEFDSCRAMGTEQYKAFAEKAKMSELLQMANRIETEEDKKKLCCYLAIFHSVDLPSLSPRLLSLINDKESSVRQATVMALSRLQDRQVRKLALELLLARGAEEVEYGLRLLEKNFDQTDTVVVARALKAVKKEHDRHRISECLLRLTEANGQAALGFLPWVLENSPCPACRKQALQLLVASECAPLGFFVEAQWDVDREVREISRQKASALYSVSIAAAGASQMQH